MEPGGDYHEGFRSLLDEGRRIEFRRYDGGAALAPELLGIDGVRRIAEFSRGFYKLAERDGRLRVTVPKGSLYGALPPNSAVILTTAGPNPRRLRIPVRGTAYDSGGPRI